jgi:RHS repeat-associated protein
MMSLSPCRARRSPGHRLITIVLSTALIVPTSIALLVVAATSASADSYSTTILGHNPLAYWRLDDTGPTAADATGHGNTCTSVGSPTFGVTGLLTTSSDTAIAANGGSGYLQCPSISLDGNAATIEAWVKPTVNSTGSFIGVGTGWPVTSDFQLEQFTNLGASSFALIADTSIGGIVTAGAEPGVPLIPGNTYHVVGVFNSGTLSLYVDGSLFGSLTGLGTLVAHGNLNIGNDPAFNTPGTGTIDEAAVYNTALTPSQVAGDFVAGNPGPGIQQDVYSATETGLSPAGYWRLDDPAGAQFAQGSVSGGNCVPTNAGTAFGTAGLLPTTSDTAVGVSAASSSWLQCPSFNLDGNAASLDAWVKPTVNTSSSFVGVGTGWPVTSDLQLSQFTNLGVSVFQLTADTPGGLVQVRGPALTVGSTYHLTGVFNNGTLTLYENEVPVVSQSGLGTLIAHGNLSIGYDPGYQTNGTGTIQEVAVYNSALTLQQIATLGSVGGNPPIGGPVTVQQAPTGSNGAIKNCPCAQSNTSRPVNLATGNFWHTFTDLTTPGRLPLNASRTYSAASAGTDGPFGFGWTFGYNLSFSQTTSTATVTEETGSQVTFNRSGSTYTPSAPRFDATLVDNGNGTVTYTRQKKQSFTFDTTTGHLTQITDLNGQGATPPYAITLSYTANQLTSVTDPAGRSYTFGWTGTHITSLTDSSTPARTITYSYDGSGNLTDVYGVNTVRTPTLQDNDHTVFTYDPSHRMLTYRMPKFFGSNITPTPVVTNLYDAQSRVTSQTDEVGRTTQFDYTSIPGSTKVTDPKGNVTVEKYQNGLLVQRTRGYGTSLAATWSYTYDPYSLGITSIMDPNGHIQLAAFDATGNKISLTDALGRKTTFTYDALNDVTSITRPKTYGSTHVVTTFGYNEAGHSSGGAGDLTSESSPLLDANGNVIATQLTVYNHSDAAHPGDVTSVVDPAGNTVTNTYDNFGDKTAATLPPTPENPAGDTTQYGYDTTKGWLTSVVSPRGVLAGTTVSCTPPALGCTTYAHDAWGHVTVTTDPLGHTTIEHYDANGNHDSSTDANSNATNYVYDPANELLTVQRADTTQLTNDYWPDGSLHDQYDGANHPTTYAYDAQGRLSTITDPNLRVTTDTYDAAGNLTGKADQGGSCTPPITTTSKCTTYSYDTANELASVSYSDGTTPNVTNVGYDPNGTRTSMTDGTGTSSWAYDSLGRQTSYTSGAGATVGYGYDLRNLTTSIAYPNSAGTVQQHYDVAGRMDSVTDWLNNQTTFAYNPDSQLITQVDPNTTTMSVTVNNADQLTGISDAPTANPNSPFASFAYGRDNAGQVNSVTSTGVPTDNNTYTYTALNQIKTVNSNPYSYDTADNLTKQFTGATQAFDSANQLCWTSPTGATGTCGTPPTGSTTYTYDTRGNRTAQTLPNGYTYTYTYDQANRLSTATSAPKIAAVAGGTSHSIGLQSDGTVWTWGLNSNGQLGNNSTTQSLVPVQVSGLSNVTAIAAGSAHSMALKSDGTVWTWGLNSNGQLGNNSTTQSLVPVQVSGLTTATAIAGGASHSLAVKSNGTAVAWGLNSNGQLGNNSTTQSLVPVAVSSLTNVVSVAAGSAHSLARKTDGTVWAWGLNSSGQLGNNSTKLSKVPVQASPLTGATAIAAGANHSVAIKSGGTAWAWGNNANGQLGINSTSNAKTPQQVNILSTATAIGGGASHSLAAQANGSVWAWGLNANGQLGNNSTTQSNVPVQTSNLPAGLNATYRYDGNGLRQSKTVAGGTTNYTWDTSTANSLLLRENTTNYIYGPDARPIEQIATGNVASFYHYDQIGSTRALTNTSGVVQATYTYDSYGNQTASTGTATTPFGWAGEYKDAETGFTYLRNRYYDAATSQFLTRDPAVAMTQSAYGYVAENPLNGTDSSGLCVGTNGHDYGQHNPCPDSVNPILHEGPDPSQAGRCPHLDADGMTCLDSAWNKANPFDGGPSVFTNWNFNAGFCPLIGCVSVAFQNGILQFSFGLGPALAFPGVSMGYNQDQLRCGASQSGGQGFLNTGYGGATIDPSTGHVSVGYGPTKHSDFGAGLLFHQWSWGFHL